MTRKEHINKIIDKMILLTKIITLVFIGFGIVGIIILIVFLQIAAIFIFSPIYYAFVFILNYIAKNHLLRLRFCNMTEEEYLQYIDEKELKNKAKNENK